MGHHLIVLCLCLQQTSWLISFLLLEYVNHVARLMCPLSTLVVRVHLIMDLCDSHYQLASSTYLSLLASFFNPIACFEKLLDCPSILFMTLYPLPETLAHQFWRKASVNLVSRNLAKMMFKGCSGSFWRQRLGIGFISCVLL